MRRFALSLVAAAVLLTGLVSQPIAAKQILHRPSDEEPETLDPQKTSSLNPLAIDGEMFTGLVTLSPTLKPVPGVAEKWEISADNKVWTFHLRHDAKWSNGDPVTADDFVYSFRRLVDPKTAAADTSDLKQVVNSDAIASGKEKDLTKLGVAAPDPYTLVITLSQPRAVFLYLLTGQDLGPLHRASVEKWGPEWTRPEHIVTNGPYHMVSWTPQSDIVLAKDPLFFDAASVKIDEVHWLDASDLQAAARRYRAGELDWTRLSRETLAWAKQNDPSEILSVPSDGNDFLFFNMAKGVLADQPDVRRAINLAIDRETLVKRIDPRGAPPAYGVVPPVIPDYTGQSIRLEGRNIADIPLDERLAVAKKLMAAHGYGPDNKLKLTVVYPTSEGMRQILLAIRQMLDPIGIDLALDNMEWQVFVARTNQRDFQIGSMGTSGQYLDFESALGNYWSGSGIYNFTGYHNQRFDELYTTAMSEMDREKRRQMIQECEQIMLEDQPTAPLEFEINLFLLSPKVGGFLGNLRFPQSRYLALKE